MKSNYITAEVMLALRVNKSLKWKVVTQSRNVLVGLEIRDGIMLQFVFICDN